MLLKKIVYLSGKRWCLKHYYSKVLRNFPEFKNAAEGEKAWLKKWSVLDKKLKPTSYRIFSRLSGPDMDIMPWEILQCIVEPCLNQIGNSDYYSDKNALDKIYGAENFPKTILRKIDGFYYDADYRSLNVDNICINKERFIIKPSKDSDGGRGVSIFRKEVNRYVNNKGEVFNVDYIENIKYDFIVQEVFKQSDFFSQFNETSVNTLRVLTYRSVIDDSIKVLGVALRIGRKGTFVDNASAGGYFIRCSEDGVLSDHLFDFYANKTSVFNGIDFSKTIFKIPNFSNIISFTKNIARNNIHNRLLALDICIDENGNPKLIEVNVKNTSIQFFEYYVPMFKGISDEIIDYCLRKYPNRIVRNIAIR